MWDGGCAPSLQFPDTRTSALHSPTALSSAATGRRCGWEASIPRPPSPSRGELRMIGIIGKKLGMTQIFNELGQQIPVTVIEAEPNPVLGVTDKAKAGRVMQAMMQMKKTSGCAAGRRSREESRPVGAAAHFAQRSSRRAGQREDRNPGVQHRRHRQDRCLRRRRHREGHRYVEGPRLSGCRQALWLRRRSEHAR